MIFYQQLDRLEKEDIRSNHTFNCDTMEFNNEIEANEFTRDFISKGDGYLYKQFKDVYTRLHISQGIRWDFDNNIYIPIGKIEVKYWLQKGMEV